MNAKWKRILSLVMSLLMMLPGSAFAQTGPVYSAEDQTALNGYIELLGDGFGLNELNADYAPFVEAFVRDEIELRNEDGGPLWQETENGWNAENTFDYAFTGEVGEDLAQLMDQLMLRLVLGDEGGELSVSIGEGEEYTLPMSNVTGHADVFAYAIGTAEAAVTASPATGDAIPEGTIFTVGPPM